MDTLKDVSSISSKQLTTLIRRNLQAEKEGASISDKLQHNIKLENTKFTREYDMEKAGWHVCNTVGELPSGGGDRDAASHLNVDQPPRRA